MAGLLGGGGTEGGGLLSGVTDTVNKKTKGLPIVGGITEPLLDTVSGVTDGLPIVGSEKQTQAPVQAQDPETDALAKKKKVLAMKKRQLALEAEEMEMDG